MQRKRAKRPRGMGSVLFRGGTWCIRFRDGGRRVFKSGYPDEGTARRVLHKALVDVSEGKPAGAPDAKNLPPLSELAETWLKRREHTHRSWRDDRSRWKTHLLPFLGHCRPTEVDHAMIRRFVEAKVAAGLSTTTTRLCVRLLSTFFADVTEQGYAPKNPVAGLPRATRRLMRPAHDPRQTPFLESAEAVRRMFLALPQPFATIFAIGALAGLRPGETLALDWPDVDLGARRMLVQRQVRHGRVGPTKSGKPRVVPIIGALAPILAEWKLATGGEGQLFPPGNPRKGGRPGAPARYRGLHQVHAALREALKACGLPETMTLYECTRHTYCALHVLGGGSLAILREIAGHASVVTTERYAHLRVDLFRPSELLTIEADFTRPGADVVDLAAHREERQVIGHASGTVDVDGGRLDGVSTHSN